MIGTLFLLTILNAFAVDKPLTPAFFDEVRTKIEEASKKEKFVGLSIAILSKDHGEYSGHFGAKNPELGIKADDRTLYEIGSVSKVFTRLLLSASIIVDPEDPVALHLPFGSDFPLIHGEELRIRDLALHTGFRFGVPCVAKKEDPTQLKCFGFDPQSEDPYAKVTQLDLFRYAAAYGEMLAWAPKQMFPAPGTFYEYSNAGSGLLGEILAGAEATSYESLLQRRILAPLRMKRTCVQLPCEPGGQGCPDVARVYRRESSAHPWKEGPLWHLPGMAGAGGLHSDLHDMRRFLAAEMGWEKVHGRDFFKTRIGAAILESQKNLPDAEKKIRDNLCKPGDPPDKACNKSEMAMFLGWPGIGKLAFYHAGETASSQSIILLSQDHSFGAVILSNSSDPTFHFPNALGLCLLELAGKLPGGNSCRSVTRISL